MQLDERGLPLSTDSADAAELFDRAVEHYLKYHADTMVLVGRMLVADPGFVLGHCLRGYLMLAVANPAYQPQIAAALKAAEAGADRVTERERMHVAAFKAWTHYDLDRSFAIWGQLLESYPTDLLAFRICDTTWFRFGQTAKILEQADRVFARWSPELPGYGMAQSVWAFAHEEAGDTAGAEPVLDEVVAHDQTNYFAHHVKAHVFEMECRPREGRDWLAAQVHSWGLGNQLIHHLWWHRTLMELELGERDAVLASYDENIRNFDDPLTKAAPDHYVDLQNAIGLLWRLEVLGVPVGERWHELAEKAQLRIGEVGHPLLVPHLVMALGATGNQAAADRFMSVLRDLAREAAPWVEPTFNEAIIPACEASLAHRRGDYISVVDLLAPRREYLRLLGGSAAQRDLYFQMLIDAAMKSGRRDVVADMIAHEIASRTVPPGARAGYAAARHWLG